MRKTTLLLTFLLAAVAAGGDDGDNPNGGGGGDDAAAKIRKNELVTIARLRNIIAAQAQLQATARIDCDADGVGEYGGFGELSGGVALRGANAALNPPVLASYFKKVENGCVERDGYRFRIFLVGAKGPVAEAAKGGFDANAVDTDKAEVAWCCYAWPSKHGETGKRAFFVSQWGDILAADANYSGDQGPAALAAFLPKQKNTDGNIATAKQGQDGNTWKVQ
jgi:hypothetical protein